MRTNAVSATFIADLAPGMRQSALSVHDYPGTLRAACRPNEIMAARILQFSLTYQASIAS
jgi:hypothetical protein